MNNKVSNYNLTLMLSIIALKTNWLSKQLEYCCGFFLSIQQSIVQQIIWAIMSTTGCT